MTDPTPTEPSPEALEIAERLEPDNVVLQRKLAAEIQAYGERQKPVYDSEWAMGVAAERNRIDKLEADLAAAQERIRELEAEAYRYRERADDHDSARQSEKERADYAETRVKELEADLAAAQSELQQALGALGYPVPVDTPDPPKYKCGMCDSALAERDELRADLMIPGEQECPTCGFSLSKLVLRSTDGAVGVNATAPLEPCPNGCGPLIGVTWRRGCTKMGDIAEAQQADLAAAQADVEAWRERCRVAEQDLAIAGVRGSPPPFEATIPKLQRELAAAQERIKTLEKVLDAADAALTLARAALAGTGAKEEPEP